MDALAKYDTLTEELMNALSATGSSVVNMQRAMSLLTNSLMALKKENEELRVSISEIEGNNSLIARRIETVEKHQTHGAWSNDWVVQKGLGHRFRVAIGAVYVGKLLVIVGLARHLYDERDGRYTVPYQRAITDGYARAYTTTSGHAHYQWHAGKTIEHIDQWMLKNGKWDEYVKIENDAGMRGFISNLYASLSAKS